MKLTPQRLELLMEAVQLREFGWTQHQIADSLGVPRRTIRDWLNSANGECAHSANNQRNGGILRYNTGGIQPRPIILFPTTYESASPLLEPESFDLILTDPPYSVSYIKRHKHGTASLSAV